MAPLKKSKAKAISTPSPLPSAFIPAITAVAVAQICVSAGYAAAEPAAVRSLSSIASLYLQTLGRSASSIAASKGRTQSNILDLVRAIEDLTADHIGFAGASDPTRPLLESSTLKDLRSFVRRVREVPFPKPIRKEKGAALPASDRASHVSPPLPPHVPRWLPGFPAMVREEGRERGDERRRWEEKGGIFEGERGEAEQERRELGFLMAKRERVRFKLATKNSSIIMKKRLMLFGDGDEHGEMQI